jgi:hypothetical protein
VDGKCKKLKNNQFLKKTLALDLMFSDLHQYKDKKCTKRLWNTDSEDTEPTFRSPNDLYSAL